MDKWKVGHLPAHVNDIRQIHGKQADRYMSKRIFQILQTVLKRKALSLLGVTCIRTDYIYVEVITIHYFFRANYLRYITCLQHHLYDDIIMSHDCSIFKLALNDGDRGMTSQQRREKKKT